MEVKKIVECYRCNEVIGCFYKTVYLQCLNCVSRKFGQCWAENETGRDNVFTIVCCDCKDEERDD